MLRFMMPPLPTMQMAPHRINYGFVVHSVTEEYDRCAFDGCHLLAKLKLWK